MGYLVKKGVFMVKEGNLEFLKIFNFLYLIFVVIKKYCEVFKDFCIEWLVVLDSDEKCEKYFLIEIDSIDYVLLGLFVWNFRV